MKAREYRRRRPQKLYRQQELRFCEVCGEALPVGRHGPRKYCSDVCRWVAKQMREKGLTREHLRSLDLDRCEACGDDLPDLVLVGSGSRMTYRSGFVFDHCHDTGRFRGVLCSNCNCGIGLAKNDVARLRGWIAYLERAGGDEGDCVARSGGEHSAVEEGCEG